MKLFRMAGEALIAVLVYNILIDAMLTNTVKPLYSGHHRNFDKVSVIRRCPLYRGIFKENFHLGP